MEEANTDTQERPNAAPAAPEKPPVDPFAASLAASLGKEFDPESLEIKPMEEKPPEEQQPTQPENKGGQDAQPLQQEEQEQPPEQQQEPGDDASGADGKSKPAQGEQGEVRRKKKRLDALPPLHTPFNDPSPVSSGDPKPPTQTKPAQPERKPDALDDPADDSLTDDQKDELEFAKYVERNGGDRYKGLVSKTRGFFSKLEKYISENPDIDPADQEFRDYVKQSRPPLTDSERRRFERRMVIEEAEKRAEQKYQAQQEATARKLRELEIKPAIEKYAAQFDEHLVETELPPEVEIEAPGKEILKLLDENPTEAYEKHPIEAPLIQSTRMAAKEFMMISTGLRDFDPKNQMHSWLSNFIKSQERNMLAKPEKVRRIQGMEFVPRDQYDKMAAQDPSNVSRYWTFNDGQVLQMMAANAYLTIAAKQKELEKAGWTRKAKDNKDKPPEPQPQAKKEQRANKQSPRSGQSPSSGAAGNQDKPKGMAEQFIATLVPGAEVDL